MIFSPAYLSAIIVKPLRYYFGRYGGEDLTWTDDPKTCRIEIDTINNYNKLPIQAKPRILVSRGQYSITPSGLTDNLAQRDTTFGPHRGTRHDINMTMLNGVAQIMIEARNEGTCEKVADLLQHFLSWTGPMIASNHGFKNFAQAINVSSCTPEKDDTEIFQCTFNIPWSREEHWKVDGADEIAMKGFILDIKV